jgi:hypothetical protein
MKTENLENDLKWFEDKRNLQLEKFNELILTDATTERIQRCYELLIKLQNLYKTMEDAIIIHRIFEAQQENEIEDDEEDINEYPDLISFIIKYKIPLQ